MGQIAGLFGYVLNYIYNIVQNYGLAIILFSILLKIIMAPITIKQQKSMEKTTEMQDKLKKIQIKCKNNPEQINQETMLLYKREHYSPFSGCLSTIVQLVIFLSVFYLVSRPLTYMKKVDSTIIQNYENEIVESGEKTTYPEIKVIEEKASEDENVYINMDFLGLNLSKVPMQNFTDIKVYIIPILYIITMFINIKMTTNMSKTKKQKEEESKLKISNEEKISNNDIDKKKEENIEEDMESVQQMTKNMNYMMPIMSIAIAIIAPLGLSLYWFISNSLQLLERLIMILIKKQKTKIKEA